MASGKAAKRKRVQQKRRPAPPVARRQPRADRRRWVLGGVAAAVLIAAAAGVIATRSGGEDPAPSEGTTLSGAGETIALYETIPQDGAVLGQADAPVTLLEFFDLQCPFCRQFATEALPPLVEQQVREGALRIEFRGLAFLGPDSERGLRAAVAAGLQGRMFQLTELLFANQGAENSGWLTQDLVEAAARSLPGVDVERLVEDMDSDAVADVISEHAADAERRGVRSTPTIFVGPTGGELSRVELSSAGDLAAVERAIAAARE